jgi:hypothetical protein
MSSSAVKITKSPYLSANGYRLVYAYRHRYGDICSDCQTSCNCDVKDGLHMTFRKSKNFGIAINLPSIPDPKLVAEKEKVQNCLIYWLFQLCPFYIHTYIYEYIIV